MLNLLSRLKKFFEGVGVREPEIIREELIGEPYEDLVKPAGRDAYYVWRCKNCYKSESNVKERVILQKFQQIPNPRIFGENASPRGPYKKRLESKGYTCPSCNATSNNLRSIAKYYKMSPPWESVGG